MSDPRPADEPDEPIAAAMDAGTNDDELARYRELEALVAAREADEAGRWLPAAALGLVVLAVSTFSWWWVTDAPTAVVAESTAPPAVWAGLVVAASAAVVGLRRAPRPPVVVTAAMLVGGLVVAGGSIVAGQHDAPGSAPWLALCGSVVTSTAALLGLLGRMADGVRQTRGPESSESTTLCAGSGWSKRQ